MKKPKSITPDFWCWCDVCEGKGSLFPDSPTCKVSVKGAKSKRWRVLVPCWLCELRKRIWERRGRR